MKRLYLFLVIFTFILFASEKTYAYKTYTIKRGDTPNKIAKLFKVRTQDIIKANNLRPKNLKPGTKIIIPSKEKDSSTAKKNVTDKHGNKISQKENKSNTSDAVKKAKNHDNGLYHIVKKGDTLIALSKKYSISVSELKEINNLKSSKLRIGQKLLVQQTSPRTYVVKKGDNIYRIARKFNIDIDDLKEINSLDTNLLKPGQKILLEPEEESEEPRTYDAIISKARIDEELKEAAQSPEVCEMSLQDKLVLFSKKLLDIPYRFGGNSLMGIDCSAFVKKVYGLIGIDLPRSAREQFKEGTLVEDENLSIGDLVFFRTYASFPSHVGIYLGDNLFIHASSRGRKVTIDNLETPYYLKRFIGGKRIIGEGTQEVKIGESG